MVAPAAPEAIFAVDGVNAWSAPVFYRDCSAPITQLKQWQPDNQVAKNFPVFLGWWPNNRVAPSITKQEIQIDISGLATECDAAVVTASASSCEFIMPNMKEVKLESPMLNLMEMLEPICAQRNILPQTMAGMIFNADGSVKEGTYYSQNIVNAALHAQRIAAQWVFTKYAQIGDSAEVFQVDGLYTQLENGWTAGDIDCGDEFNVAQSINWFYLTDEAAVASSVGSSSPDAVTVTGKTVTLHGVSYDVPAGLNLAQFLDRFWFRYIHQGFTYPYGEVMWEMHTHSGEDYCLRESIACIQPCGNDSNFDKEVRQRWVDVHNTDIMTLKPSGQSFALLQSPEVDSGTYWLGPRSIGGTPTYGLAFQPLAPYWTQLGEATRQLYGQQFGQWEAEDMLIWEDQTFIQQNFDDIAFLTDVYKQSMSCLKAGMMFKYGVVASARHLWLKITGLGCSTIISTPDDSVVIID